MKHHGYGVSVGDQVFIDGNNEEIGAVRQVKADQVVVYIENAGEFPWLGEKIGDDAQIFGIHIRPGIIFINYFLRHILLPLLSNRLHR